MKKLLEANGVKTNTQFYILLLEKYRDNKTDEATTLFKAMTFKNQKEFLFNIIFDGCESNTAAQQFFFDLL